MIMNCQSLAVRLWLSSICSETLELGGFGEALGNDVSQLQAIVPTVKQLLEAFRARHLPIVHTIEGHHPDLFDCPPSKQKRGQSKLKIGDRGPRGRILILGEPGNSIISELTPLPHEIVINKPGNGAFNHTNLELILREKAITHLIFTGVTTEVCVQTTIREANDRGFEGLLVEDATASYFPQFKQSAIDMIRAQGGIIGWTARAEVVIQALEKSQP